MDRYFWEICDRDKSWRVYQDGSTEDLDDAQAEIEEAFKDAAEGNYRIRIYGANLIESRNHEVTPSDG